MECVRKNETTISATKTVQDGTVTQVEFQLQGQLLHHGCKDGSLIDVFDKVKEVKTKEVVTTLTERLAPALVFGQSKKRVPKSANRAEANKADIIADFKSGMGWSSLIGKYRVNPKHLKAILTEAKAEVAGATA